MTNEGTLDLVLESSFASVSADNVTLRQKSAFAVQHLMAAARFSRQCGEVQNRNRNFNSGSFYDEQISCVSATVMLSVASIESYVNELLSEPDKLFPELDTNVHKEICSLLVSLSILDKYQKILSIKGISEFDRSRQPLQDVETLISLRNEFVHFQPEWHDEQERHRKLGLKLRGKFELSPFISEETGVLFPQRIVSHGCTKWAVTKSMEFMEEFTIKIGFKSKFENHSGSLDV